MPSSNVAIIVLNWNRKDDTLECLDSLENVKYGLSLTVLVDNGSDDHTVDSVRSRFRDVHIIETGENLGYVGGNNIGISYALKQGAEYIFVLNNDTIVAEDVLDHLVEFAEANPKAGIVGPKVYRYDQPNQVLFAGATFDRYGVLVHDGLGQIDEGQFGQERETCYIPGCSMLVKKSVIADIGSFDQLFFCLFEEVDLCFRARRAGYSLHLIPSAHIWHKESHTFGGTAAPLYLYYFTRNHLLFLKRNFKGKELYRLYYHTLRDSYRQWMKFRSCREPKARQQALAIKQGIWDFWRGSFGKCCYEFISDNKGFAQ